MIKCNILNYVYKVFNWTLTYNFNVMSYAHHVVFYHALLQIYK